MMITVELPAPQGGRWDEIAFRHQIDRPIPVRLPNGSTVTGVVLAAVVMEQGQVARVTFNLPREAAEQLKPQEDQW